MRRKTVILIGFLLSFLIFIGLITFKLSNNQKDKLSIYSIIGLIIIILGIFIQMKNNKKEVNYA